MNEEDAEIGSFKEKKNQVWINDTEVESSIAESQDSSLEKLLTDETKSDEPQE